MKKALFALLCLFLFSLLANAQAINKSVETKVSKANVFSNGYSIITRTGDLDVGAGEWALLFANVSEKAVDDSIMFSDSHGKISSMERYYDEKVSSKNESHVMTFTQLLEESLGKDIVAYIGSTEVAGKLVWYDKDKIGIQYAKGVQVIREEELRELRLPINQTNKTEEMNTTHWEKGLMVKEVSSQGGQRQVSLTYGVPGVDWSEHYKYYLYGANKKGSATFQAWATVKNNAGEDWSETFLTINIGYPNIVSYTTYRQSYDYYSEKAYAAAPAMAAVENAVDSVAQAVFSSGYWTYEFGDPVSIANGAETQMPLFESQIPYEELNLWNTAWSSPHRVYKLNNTGSQPWGAGVVRIYQDGKFIGEDTVSHTPKNIEAEVTVSDLPDFKVKKETLNETTKKQYNDRITETRKRLTLENQMETDAELVVRDALPWGDKVEVVSSTHEYTLKPNSIVEWVVPVAKGKQVIVEYTTRAIRYDYY